MVDASVTRNKDWLWHTLLPKHSFKRRESFSSEVVLFSCTRFFSLFQSDWGGIGRFDDHKLHLYDLRNAHVLPIVPMIGSQYLYKTTFISHTMARRCSSSPWSARGSNARARLSQGSQCMASEKREALTQKFSRHFAESQSRKIFLLFCALEKSDS
jgi:hypothetical protein